MFTEAQKVGYRGEQMVARRYRERGCDIYASNFSVRVGELDLVVFDGRYLRFVEVKTRSPGAMLAPAEAVDEAKRQRLVAAARIFMRQAEMENLPVRFDVAEVLLHDLRNAEINILEDAFADDSFLREASLKTRLFGK